MLGYSNLGLLFCQQVHIPIVNVLVIYLIIYYYVVVVEEEEVRAHYINLPFSIKPMYYLFIYLFIIIMLLWKRRR